MRASDERYDAAVTTAFRWRHRSLKAVGLAPDTLKGIVEADKRRWSRLSDSPAASLRGTVVGAQTARNPFERSSCRCFCS